MPFHCHGCSIAIDNRTTLHCYRDTTYCSMTCIEQAILADNNIELHKLIKSHMNYFPTASTN